MFNKRHFEVIAEAMQEARRQGDNGHSNAEDVTRGVVLTARVLADAFSRTSPGFKRERFLRACEPGANVKART